MKPRVHIATQFLSPGSGGISRCARLTTMALGEIVDVASAFAAQDFAPVEIGAVTTVPFFNRRLRFVAANTVAALKSDCVIYDFPGTARAHSLLGFAKRPFAVWAHGYEVWSENLRSDYAQTIRRADAVFVNSDHTYGRLNDSIPGLRNVQKCWLGTEKDVDRGASIPPANMRENIVLFVGRNDELFAKGQDILIDVWPQVVARVPDARLCLVGGGNHLEHLQSLASKSPVAASISVMGQLEDGHVEDLYRKAKVFAMLSKVEGFGLVFVEAMSHGLPIITSRQDASQEINQEGEAGYSVNRSDKRSLIERISAVLQDDDLFARLSANAYRRWATNFSFSAFSSRFSKACTNAKLF